MRFFRAFRYLPAVATAMIATMWIVSEFASVFGMFASRPGIAVWMWRGSLELYFKMDCQPHGDVPGYEIEWSRAAISWETVFGTAGFHFEPTNGWYTCTIPYCCLITILLPFALGPFTRYRFALWMWFAYTALLAAEIAYYCR